MINIRNSPFVCCQEKTIGSKISIMANNVDILVMRFIGQFNDILNDIVLPQYHVNLEISQGFSKVMGTTILSATKASYYYAYITHNQVKQIHK